MRAGILVVGGDGFLGSALVSHLRRGGHKVHTTTRKRERVSPDTFFLDLVDLSDDWRLPADISAVIIVAAVTGRDTCEEDPEGTYKINVLLPVSLVQRFIARRVFCLFLSTNLVLGGDAAFLSTAMPYRPCDAYSTQKAEAERQMLALDGACDNLAILRLSKVLNPNAPLFRNWLETARRGIGVEAFGDVVIAPVTGYDACQAIEGIIVNRLSGVHHFSGGREISFAELARNFLDAMGFPPELVIEVAGRITNPVAALTPPHNSLDMSGLQSKLGLQSPMPEDTISKIANQIPIDT